MTTEKRVRVLIIDDSAVVRSMVRKILLRDSHLEIVGAASNPYEAKDMILQTKPDVLTLDIEMPRMDGLTFLKILMKEHPLPVIILSSLTQEGSDVAFEALRLGAVDVIAKPQGSGTLNDIAPVIIEKIKGAAEVGINRIRHTYLRNVNKPQAGAAEKKPANDGANAIAASAGRLPVRNFTKDSIILIGASTGGTEAIKAVLKKFPEKVPPIAVVQHIPPYFSKSFADRLNQICAMEVREARDGDRLKPGICLIAPGDFHMLLQKDGSGYFVRIQKGPKIWHQRPAVDMLFKSAVSCANKNVTATILTGMGKDGAEGMLELKRSGAKTLAQDEASSVVYGMPRAAKEIGAVDQVVSLNRMAESLLNSLS